MTLTELQAQIALGKDSRRQFKRDVTNADSLAAEMAAFANSEGGTLYLGVSDEDDRERCLFIATIHRKALEGSVSSPKGSPKTENQIIELIKQDAFVSTDHLGEILGISKRAVLKQIQKLKTRTFETSRPRQRRPLGGGMT